MRYFLLSLYALVYCTTLTHAQCSGPVIINYPYQEDFEAGPGGWVAGGLGNDWALGTPNKPIINSAGSGTRCWVTGGLSGSFYQLGERSYVESPCFNFAILTRPYIRFKIWWETEKQFDGANLQYSLDGGNIWTNVGSVDDPVNCLNENWYNSSSITNLSGLTNVRQGWSGNVQPTNGSCLGGSGSGGWLVAKHCMLYLAGEPSVKFRFTFGAGTTCNDFDGVAFDDIRIENAPPIVATFLPTCPSGNTYIFNDLSTNCPQTWSWDFGDPASGADNVSTNQNTAHTYAAPGLYTVTLIASSICSGSTTAIRTVKIFGMTITTTPVSCAGGNDGQAAVQVTPAGSTPAYSWSTMPVQTGATATNLTAGTYTVALIENSVCPAITTVTITEPAVLQHVTTVQNAACGNASGSATVTETGGTPPYAYAWSPTGGSAATATNLVAGNYVLSITDQQGCVDTAQVTIANTPPVQVNITNVVQVACFGGMTGRATVNVTAGSMPFTYAWSPTGGTGATATGLPAGAYQVTVTDANFCTATATVTITQPNALLHTSTTTAAACGSANGSATIMETGGTAPYTYVWSPSGGTNASATGLFAGNYAVTVTDSRGCTDTVQINISNIGGVQAAISANVPVSCFGGQDGGATVTATGGTTPYTYSWSPAGGNGATATGLAASNYFVTVTDANQCVAALAVSIVQPEILTHAISAQPAVCGDPNGSALVVASGGMAPYSYAWSPTGGNGSMASNLAPGNYVVSITDQAGCPDTAQVIVMALPDVQATIPGVVPVTCFGGSDGSAVVQATSGEAPYTYAWSPTGGSMAIATGLTAGTYTVTVTDTNQCTTTAMATVSEPLALQHSITASQDAACQLATGTATIQETGGLGPYTYAWSPSGGSKNTATGLLAGNYVVSVTDQSGCTDTVQVTIGEIPGVQAAISGTVNVHCFGDSTGAATVTATVGAPPYAYAWPAPGGNGATATGLAAGSYVVTVTDANTCTATATATITQPPALQYTTTVSPVTCQGMNGSATILPNGGNPPYTYNWQPAGGNTSMASGLAVGDYSITVSDQQGCSTTVLLSIDSVAGVQSTITALADVSCFGAKDGSLTVMGMGGTLPYQYLWSPSVGTGNTLTGLAPGSYSVTVTDADGCASLATAVVLDAIPVNTQAHGIAVRCYGEKSGAISVDTTTGGLSPYLYALQSSAFGPQTLFSGLSAGNYVLSTQDAKGCVTLDSITIDEPPPATVQVGSATTITLGDSLLLTALVSDPGRMVQYEWRPPVGVTCPSCSSTFAQPFTSTTYTVYVYDSSGCIISASRVVTVKKASVYIPNVFAPDAGNGNDYFTLYAGAGVEEIALLQVYDRWGALVFENQHFMPSSERAGWDGQIRGKAAAVGVYTYLFQVRLRDGTEEVWKGDVTVVR